MKQLIADIQARIKEADEIDVLYPDMDQLFAEIDLTDYSKEIEEICRI